MTIPVRHGILTLSRRYWSFHNIEQNHVAIEEIAHGLAFECRYGNQCPEFWSVAQHSLLVVDILREHYGISDPMILLQGLLHDASEAFLGDMTTPLKNLLPDYKALEERTQNHLLGNLHVDANLHPSVRLADLLALGIEKRDIWENYDKWEVLGNLEIPKDITVWSLMDLPFKQVRIMFLDLFHTLRHQMLMEKNNASHQ
jgi:hypothetical protein